jgi:hypothetical protein
VTVIRWRRDEAIGVVVSRSALRLRGRAPEIKAQPGFCTDTYLDEEERLHYNEEVEAVSSD